MKMEDFVYEPEKKLSIFDRLTVGGEKETFVENLALLLASGMDTVSALSALKKEAKARGLKVLIGQIQENVEGGLALSVALAKTGLFGTNITALIKIGEETGRLAENLRVVAANSEKERAFRAKIAGAMMYPVLVLTLTIIIGVSISWVVLPRLATVFAQLRITLPPLTQVLIAAGVFLGKYGAVFVPVLIVFLLFLVYFIFIFPKTKFIGRELLFAFPGIGELVAEVELSRFGYMLGGMLGAGLPVVTAFDSLIGVTEFASYKRFYRFLRDRVEEGNSFAKSFALYPHADRLMPPSIQQMIIAAEQSGFLADTLIKIGERFEEKTEVSTKNISTILEPILLVIVWFGVAGVALAIILPIYSLVGGFTQSETGVAPAPTASQLGGQAAPTPTLEATATPTPTPREIRVIDTGTGFLNIREEPALGAAIIGRALPGETYEFLDKTDEWYLIIFSGRRGWVNAAYVEEVAQ
ncbi:MAG: type II secretion system F family protein [Microgenomates group bacterium]